ncbi:hypothetical protein Peur_001915 [Populus x canadensis]
MQELNKRLQKPTEDESDALECQKCKLLIAGYGHECLLKYKNAGNSEESLPSIPLHATASNRYLLQTQTAYFVFHVSSHLLFLLFFAPSLRWHCILQAW